MPLDRDLPKREILPIPDRPYVGPTKYNAVDPQPEFPPLLPIRPPEGAPNVIVILIDDVGFGASEPFGGPIKTPTAESLAKGGLKYTRFHTSALCSPTRAALLTGRNPHSVGMGCITEMATSAPGATSMIPNSAASIAKILKYNGYSTAQFGKCHEVPTWETGTTGPFDHWPTYMGFEKFYGFVGGETNQYYPTLYDGTTYIEMPERGDYHLTTDLANQAIKWIETQKSLAPDKPFFMYFAPGATHAPHQVPEEWSNNYRGEFDAGWDELRKATFERQKELGVIPQDAKLTTPHEDDILPWKDMPAEVQDSLKREMEIYAGFLEHTDHQIGRVIETLKTLKIFENTLIFYILGDNGASAEGTFLGTFNEMIGFNGIEMSEQEQIDIINNHIEEFGTKKAYNHYAIGWAQAMCTPYKWTKQVASHFGGTRNGMIVHWPKGIKVAAGRRDQFAYVTDVLPTVLEAIGLPEPLSVDGVLQKPIEGLSFFYTFNEDKAADRHRTQYFEMFGNRGIYHEGWTAVTLHSKPWQMYNLPDYAEDKWELYYTYDANPEDTGSDKPQVDWTQATDLSQVYPDKLAELKNLFQIEAARYNVFPLDDRKIERLPPPQDPSRKQRYVDGSFVADPVVIDTFNRSFNITAQITVPADLSGPVNGVILARGNDFGGFGLYAKNGILTYVYNYLGLEITTIPQANVNSRLPSGTYQVRMEFTYEGGEETGQGGTVKLFRKDGESDVQIGLGKLEKTNPVIFNVDAFLMVGNKTGGPLCPDLEGNNRFTGTVDWAEIEVTGLPGIKSPEHRVHALMAIE
ncbi:arylsulfatase [Hyalangium versicolor]|uniref:arylsulfatase n=1 Tax=Hyalangium versicolor TaxID=2861190 RepID=UPI001CCC7ACC|nr:arylsulfatase [Hyalangium versicolor]